MADPMAAVQFSGVRGYVVMFRWWTLVAGVVFGVFVFINMYMPCDSDDASRSEFCDTLNVIESITDDNDGCSVVLGGDFNVDFDRKLM